MPYLDNNIPFKCKILDVSVSSEILRIRTTTDPINLLKRVNLLVIRIKKAKYGMYPYYFIIETDFQETLGKAVHKFADTAGKFSKLLSL